MINTFDSIGINPSLVEGLKKEGISEPTPIQINSIPLALNNRDVIGQSQTGSGKTLAYLLPIFQKIDSNKREMQVFILAPTHELVMQIDTEIKLLANNSGIPVTSITIIGEVNINRQLEKLREKPHIIVGSVGRILQIIKLKKINSQTVKTIIIDEADILLDTNNISVVKEIIKTTMKDRQLMIFSATINEKTLNIAKDLMNEADVVKIEESQLVNSNITHMYMMCEQRDKINMLRKLISSLNPERAIIFLNKNDEIQITTNKLKYHQLKVYGIYGNAPKEERQKAMEGFRTGKYNLLVASDLAARGLDITDVTHIINLDLPEDSREYLHRVGRTSRAGKTGIAVSIINEREEHLIKNIERDFKIVVAKKELYQGKVVLPGMGKKIINKVLNK